MTGNPDEIWIHRKGAPSAYLFSLSQLQASEPPVVLVAHFRKHIQKTFLTYRDVAYDRILIRKYGENGLLCSSVPVTALAGNTDDTPHRVEVYNTNNTPHTVSQKAFDDVQWCSLL